MKKIVLAVAAFAFAAGAMAQTLQTRKASEADKIAKLKAAGQANAPVTAQPSPDAVIKVNTVKHDFGKIKQGVPVAYSFEIKNISNKPVVVENTSASCGCTTPEKITEPIAPGASAKLKVQYNAAAAGTFIKDVHIKLAGIAQDKVVQITGEVVAAEAPKQ
ncbi:MAG: DUF1573 domain-containing protein [Chitinophagaceae bacterium]|nr:DUF1573 domain-containing protein [Chitinophagaceae bacterium]